MFCQLGSTKWRSTNHRIIECPGLKGTHKDYGVQPTSFSLPFSLHSTSPHPCCANTPAMFSTDESRDWGEVLPLWILLAVLALTPGASLSCCISHRRSGVGLIYTIQKSFTVLPLFSGSQNQCCTKCTCAGVFWFWQCCGAGGTCLAAAAWSIFCCLGGLQGRRFPQFAVWQTLGVPFLQTHVGNSLSCRGTKAANYSSKNA